MFVAAPCKSTSTPLHPHEKRAVLKNNPINRFMLCFRIKFTFPKCREFFHHGKYILVLPRFGEFKTIFRSTTDNRRFYLYVASHQLGYLHKSNNRTRLKKGHVFIHLTMGSMAIPAHSPLAPANRATVQQTLNLICS